MRTESRIFGLLAAVLFVFAAVYAWWTWENSGRVEYIGTIALLLSGALCAVPAGFMFLVSRRIDPRPEDRADAEPSEAAGEVGFFSPASYWPLLVGLSAVVAAMGIAVSQYWMLGVGLLGAIVSAAALLYEYYTGSRRGAEW